MTDDFLAIQGVLTAEERKAFLDNFMEWNPQWSPLFQGAHVADVLAMLYDVDAHLDHTEPMREAHGRTAEPMLLTLATIAALYAYGDASWERVRGILARLPPG